MRSKLRTTHSCIKLNHAKSKGVAPKGAGRKEMRKQLQSLFVKENELMVELAKIRDKKEKFRTAEGLPPLKLKYEGKYFKYANSYGADTRWWIYSKCKKVKSLESCLVFSFEITATNKINIEEDGSGHFHLFQKEISKEEFYSAYNKMLEKIKSGVV